MHQDTEVFDLIKAEENRQRNGLELIASENLLVTKITSSPKSISDSAPAQHL